jgi:hypothetical protein
VTAEDLHLIRLAALSAAPGTFTLMETALQDIPLAVYPRIKVLFQPTERTYPHVVSKAFQNGADDTHGLT